MIIKKIVYVLILIILLNTKAYSESRGGAAGSILNYGVGARPLGLGGTFIGISDSIEAICLNAAGLSRLNYTAVSIQYSTWYDSDTYYAWIGFLYNLNNKNKIGLGVVRLSTSGIKAQETYEDVLSTFSSDINLIHLAYSRKLFDFLYPGVTLKLVNKKIYKYNAFGIGADISAYTYTTEIKKLIDWNPITKWIFPNAFIYEIDEISIGICVRNVFPPTIKLNKEKEKYPLTFAGGISFKMFKKKFLIGFDILKSKDSNWEIHIGSDINFKEVLKLRWGINNRDIWQPSFGIGIGLDNFLIDYACIFHYIKSLHTISLSYKFSSGKKEIIEEKEEKKKEEKKEEKKKTKGRKLTSKEKEEFEYYYYSGLDHYIKGGYEWAIDEWKKALKIKPGDKKTLEYIRKARRKLKEKRRRRRRR